MLKDYLIKQQYSPVNDLETVEMIKASDAPLVLWGAGEVAEKVYKILVNNKIDLSAVWVDGDNGNYFHGIITRNLDDIISQYKKFNVIVGHNRYDKINKLKDEFCQIENVFYFYNSFGWEEGFDQEYFSLYEDEFQNAFELAQDDLSAEAYSQYINSRIWKNPCYVTSKCVVDGYFNNDVLSVTESEALLEIGAYNGNIIRIFNKETNGRYSKIIAFEPDESNFATLEYNIKDLHDIELHKIGCWNKKAELSFCVDGTGKSNHIDESGQSKISIPVDAVDNIIGDRTVTFINIFYQTGIMEMLEGARKTIVRDKPKLIVGIGLRKEHAFMIPQYIKKLNPEYRLFYRFYGGVPSRFYLIAT